MIAAPTLSNARRALRDALHQRVRGVDDWAEPSIAVFRNFLLDDVGSDARPLTNLLLEAIDRGVLESLPQERLAPAQWTARCTSLVMQWVGERFVQPEAARWAVESWAYALGTIEASQLTMFVDTPTAQDASSAAGDGIGSAPMSAAQASRAASPRAASALPPVARATPSRAARTPVPVVPSAWRTPSTTSPFHTTAGGRNVPYARPVPRAVARTTPPRKPSGFWPEPLDNLVGKSSVVVLVAMLVVIAVQIAWSPADAPATALASAGNDAVGETNGTVSAVSAGNAQSADPANEPLSEQRLRELALLDSLRSASWSAQRNAPLDGGTSTISPSQYGAAIQGANGATTNRATDGIGIGGEPTRVSLAPGSGNAPSLAMTRLPAEGATPNAYRELAERSNVRVLRGAESGPSTAPSAAGNAPGVPGITRSAMPLSDADMANVRRIAPATRPTPRGASPPPPSRSAPAAGAPGRAAPGLDELRLESGRRIQGRVEIIRASSVVFRDAQTGLRYEFPKDDIDEVITEFGNSVRFRQQGGAKPGSAGDRRTVNLSGRYVLRYEAARVVGSATCADLWRGPSGTDIAVVSHRAGDDTLSVKFDGGDSFPSVLDADGFFNSTFRIMPGQAELATALTTRISGWISPERTLALQINVIGYRRVQGTSGVSCHIIVDATGSRSP